MDFIDFIIPTETLYISMIENEHERDQSFLVPVRKKFSSRSRSRRKKVLGLGAGPSQKYFGHGPGLGPGTTLLISS
jgi:hypothetical protein